MKVTKFPPNRMKAEETDTDAVFGEPESTAVKEHQSCPIPRGSGILLFVSLPVCELSIKEYL
jgi:hypothetical protein